MVEAPLDGQTVLITGASGGLGWHFAEKLAEAGAHIGVCGRRRERLEELVRTIVSAGGRAEALDMDVADCSSIDRAIAAAEHRMGSLNVLINNSGVSAALDAVDTSQTQYDRIMDTNLRGAFFVATGVARRMIARREGGSIINISSVAASRPMAQRAVYCMSKAGLSHMTKVLALEWARYGIRVNAIAPGWIGTPDNVKLFQTEAGKDYLKRFPRGRLGSPDCLDGALLLLATEAGRFMTGETIIVDDGFSLAL